MSSLAGTAAIAVGAFVGTNADSLIALSGQLAAAERRRHRRIAEGQLAATLVVLAVAALGGAAFSTIPRAWIGLLGLVPIAMGVRSGVLLVRRRGDDRSVPIASGLITSFAVTLAISADNVAVYVPVLAGGTKPEGVLAVAIWLVLDLGLIVLARWLGAHPRAEAAAARVGPWALPVLYVAVGLVVLLRSSLLG